MSEARELFGRLLECVEVAAAVAVTHDGPDAKIWNGLLAILQATLATQPEPGAVPELPEFVQIDAAGDYAIKVGSGHVLTCSSTSISPDDLDVIGDTFHILAARERARRAGS